MSNAELADRLESLAAAWGLRPAGKATILEAAAALRAYVNDDARWHKWPKEKPPRSDWYLVKDSRRKVPTVDHYKNWASSGDEWDGAVTHWHPLPDTSSISSQRLGE